MINIPKYIYIIICIPNCWIIIRVVVYCRQINKKKRKKKDELGKVTEKNLLVNNKHSHTDRQNTIINYTHEDSIFNHKFFFLNISVNFFLFFFPLGKYCLIILFYPLPTVDRHNCS